MGLGILDNVLLVISLIATACIGIYHGVIGLKATPKEYMLGGQAMNPIPLALSMTVGTVSAITILANAGEMYAYGTQLWMMDLGIAIGLVIVAKVFIPIFYPMQMVSLYQYVEARFKSKLLRKITVGMTMLQAYAFMGFLLFAPTIILKYITGLSTYTTLFLVGLTSTVYSAFGGIKAVVYTDSLQSLVMIIGVLAIVIQASQSVGGISTAWDIAFHHQRIEFFNFNLDPYQRHSFWLTVTYGIFFSLSTYGVNQSQVQRAFSTGSVKQAQAVFYYAAIGMVVLRGLINLSGIMVFAYYSGCDPLTTSKYGARPLAIISTYVLSTLTKIPGLTGLFVASIYAAVLSSMSTQVNSLTALLWEDFLKTKKYFSTWTEIKITKLQKVLVFLSGIIGILFALLTSKLINFLQALYSITGAISGPMIGLFLVALFAPWVKWKAVSLGYLIGIIISLWIVCGQLFSASAPLLPMSYDNCTTNFTIYHNVTSSEPYRGEGLYGLSYCLNYVWGSLACVLVALFVSLFAETNTPETVSEKYVDPFAWKCFKRYHQHKDTTGSTFKSLLRLCICSTNKNSEQSELELQTSNTAETRVAENQRF